ncbi:hypothetical protein [Mycolicibacterium llatzerense]|uniref:hypothetical protein n=1 Tax=Mycolicibacterium llatzerense TaxID=280871 RepID=UPI0021B57020|nr:hypothetical protein [Mycolicibacterium llatzerense]
MGSAERKAPPQRVRGMLGPDTSDEFPKFYGWTPPVLRSQIDDFDNADAAAVLYGDGSGHGGHADVADSPPNKSKFPKGWREPETIDWVRSVVDVPLDGYDDGDGFSLFGRYLNVSGVLRVRPVLATRSWYLATGHPMTQIDWDRERGRAR